MNNSATIRLLSVDWTFHIRLLHLRSFAIESCCLKVLSFKIKSRCLNTQCFVYNLTTQQMWQQKGFKYRMIVLKVPWLVKSHGQRTSVATTFYALFAHGSRIDTIKYLISDKPCPSSDHLQPGRWWRWTARVLCIGTSSLKTSCWPTMARHGTRTQPTSGSRSPTLASPGSCRTGSWLPRSAAAPCIWWVFQHFRLK